MDVQRLTASIQQHEGLSLKIYQDSVGKWSIGYGRNLSDIGISPPEAEYLLGNDIQSAIHQAQAQEWWPNVSLNDARSRAFVEIVFNIGLGVLAGFRKALDAAMRSDWNACSAEFLDSLWSRQVGKRAETLCAMIQTGSD